MPLIKTSALPFGNAARWILDKVRRFRGPLAGKAVQNAAHTVSEAAPGAAKTVVQGAEQTGKGLIQGAEQTGKGVVQGAEQTGKAAPQTVGQTGEAVQENAPSIFERMTNAVGRKVNAAGDWAYGKLPSGVQKRLAAANDWRVKNKVDLGLAGDMFGTGMMAYFTGNDLANGESLGSVAGNLAGFYGGSRLMRRFLPKKEGWKWGAARFLGDAGAGLVGSMGLQYLGDKYMPIGRLAKPLEESYGAAPQNMTKGAEENSMNKTAMIKEAEVAGVLAAFTDAGLMQKFASDDFDYLTEKVAENLPSTYTVDDVAYVADALLSGGVEKTAEEAFIEETAPIMGYALMAKLAGEMDDDDLDDFVAGYFEGAGF